MNNRGLIFASVIMLMFAMRHGTSAQTAPPRQPWNSAAPSDPPPSYPTQVVSPVTGRGGYSVGNAQPVPDVGASVPSPRGTAGSASSGVVQADDHADSTSLAPFQLTTTEEAFRDQVLRMWETESGKIITFKCTFDRWEYSEYGRGYIPEGPGFPQRRNTDVPWIKSHGLLAYAKPDKGSFQIEEIYRYQWDDTNKKDDWPRAENDIGERWVCDGQYVYNYNHKEKQLEISPIPPELQGKAIVDGPLPFLFGAEADKLKQRYWIRVSQSNEEEIWLDTYPKYQADAASYRRVEVILDKKGLLPKAMQVYMPNGDRTVYMFDKPAINNQIDRLFGIFKPPRTPFGWKRIMLDTPQQPNQSQPPQQAQSHGTQHAIPRTRY